MSTRIILYTPPRIDKVLCLYNQTGLISLNSVTASSLPSVPSYQTPVPIAQPRTLVPNLPTPCAQHTVKSVRSGYHQQQRISHHMRHARHMLLLKLRARVTTPLMPLHVTPHAKSLPTPGTWALERLLSRVRMAVDLQTGWSAESLAARPADVPVLGLRVRGLRRSANVVVVLPRVAGRQGRRALCGQRHLLLRLLLRGEVGGKRPLRVEACAYCVVLMLVVR